MNILLIVDKHTTVTSAYVTYLKQPDPITIDSELELADHLVEELARSAVEMYYADKFKLNIPKSNGNESSTDAV